ncbi:MAG: 16S rRNA (uracil(1498)-N(3))-methyltransferase [Lachnospiraceae bacterium]|uniref:16S rRNA (uracil(1498)-N(3))-methyltransferase n=1 Tax=Roseburia hominis TaxID=301301 RepID=UPI001F344ABE|nr:16S rRNA (uracil(1498)-N(3))-methyltransferase [Roseburia hominis]MCI5713223.1 16S rRNA (uracil(1498)-N(3))-methyltransferase [Lachnospiraceae bacterium]MDD6170297.1 16S rRNA (uracil(1498)-N(3))-methyltransferase [Lachnospiraceae bacterium]MDY4838568.1 16S rRNA (uracil(1498)-N(3))-methyltransferase [Lachnospiraceae bacterium]
MYQFFVDDAQIGKEFITIIGSDVNHIKNVLRMKPGEKIRVSNQKGQDYFCSIIELGDDFVQADILDSEAANTELSSKIYLFQALPKGDRMETVIQKAVELGVHEIIPVAMKYCVVKLDAKKAENKRKRWQAIAESAAKQSKRSLIPVVHEVMSFKEALSYAKECKVNLVPYENERGMEATKEAVLELKKDDTISVMIGPEGGFSEEEIELVKEENMKIISLGKRILRTDTAAIATLSMLMLQLEMLEQK